MNRRLPGDRHGRAKSDDRASLEELGRRLSSARLDAGLSVSEVAARLGVSGPYVSVLERGQRTPAEPVLIRTAAVLDLSVRDLLTLAGHGTDQQSWPPAPLIELAIDVPNVSVGEVADIRDFVLERRAATNGSSAR